MSVQETTDMQKTVWKMCRNQLDDPAFQETKVRPIAKKLAATFWTVLAPQLTALGISRLSREIATELYEGEMERLTQAFYDALILRALMKVAPDRYSMIWPKRGEPFDRTKMKERHAHKGPSEVVWTRSPMIVVQNYIGKQHREIISFADVETRSPSQT